MQEQDGPKDGDIQVDAVGDVLLKAACLIEDKGFCKNDLYRDGAYCLRGAINKVVHGSHRFPPDGPLKKKFTEADDRAEQYLRSKFTLGAFEKTFNWNNKPERTKEDVVAALRGAAQMKV